MRVCAASVAGLGCSAWVCVCGYFCVRNCVSCFQFQVPSSVVASNRKVYSWEEKLHSKPSASSEATLLIASVHDVFFQTCVADINFKTP